jgi:hypothetical protein
MALVTNGIERRDHFIARVNVRNNLARYAEKDIEAMSDRMSSLPAAGEFDKVKKGSISTTHPRTTRENTSTLLCCRGHAIHQISPQVTFSDLAP